MFLYLKLIGFIFLTTIEFNYLNVSEYDSYRFLIKINSVFSLESKDDEFLKIYYDKENLVFKSEYLNDDKPLISMNQLDINYNNKKRFDTLISGILNTWGMIVSKDLNDTDKEFEKNLIYNEKGIIESIKIKQESGNVQEMKISFASINDKLVPDRIQFYINGNLAIIFNIDYQIISKVVYPKTFVFKNNANEVVLKLEVFI